MRHTLKEVSEIARELTNEEKLQLADLLLGELDPPDAEIHRAWEAEVGRRIDADKMGLLEAHDFDDVIKQYIGE